MNELKKACRASVLAVLATLMVSQQAVAIEAVEYIHTDALGSPVASTNERGDVIERSTYEPYGSLANRPPNDRPGYTGHVTDSSTGLSYMQQRYMDPQLGSFLSVDPVVAYGQPEISFNRYRYGNGNPYKFTDPDGRNAMLLEVGIPLMIGLTAVYASTTPEQRAEIGRISRAAVGVVAKKVAEGARALVQKSENNNPYDGPVSEPVTVVDGDGNAIPVQAGEEIKASPDGRYQQVRDREGNPTGTRLDKGGHKGQSDPKAQGPHGHRPGVTDEVGNPHLPLNEPKPKLEGF